MKFYISEKTGETCVIDDSCFTNDHYDSFDVTMMVRPWDNEAVACHLTYGRLSYKRIDWVDSLPEQDDREVTCIGPDGSFIPKSEMDRLLDENVRLMDELRKKYES